MKTKHILRRSYFKFLSVKILFVVLLSAQSFSVFAQLSAIEKEALDLINPIYAKVVSDMDTIFILKNEVTEKQEHLQSLELFAVDTIRIDSMIIYEEKYNTRTFSTRPIYNEETKRFVKRNAQILKIGSLNLDQLRLQTG